MMGDSKVRFSSASRTFLICLACRISIAVAEDYIQVAIAAITAPKPAIVPALLQKGVTCPKNVAKNSLS